MTEILIVLGLLAIAAAAGISRRWGIAPPLILVAVGVAASFLPAFASIEIEPEWILAGILPPLLYSSAVSMPAMNFRREFGAIGGLSVVLVVASALLLGAFFTVVIPGLDFAWGVALGAIVSPTDAVATSILKRMPVSKRVVAMLDGESLLNDATALVILRTAIVATAASFSFWGAAGSFAYSVVVAIVVGGLVGWVNLAVRRRVGDPTVNTVISFTVPFLASVPAELLGASGLVAAVVAGLVTGIRAPRELSPQNRLSDSQNWRTVELVLEGAVFLTMGLQITSILENVERDHAGIVPAVLIACAALLLTVLIRGAYLAPLLASLARRGQRSEDFRKQLEDMQQRMASSDDRGASMIDERPHRGRSHPSARAKPTPKRRSRVRRFSERQLELFTLRITRGIADIDYFVREPLGWRQGTIVVWAGMRGAVTVAAAQTLPDDTPQRSTLVLIAFTVAALSLLVQGGTIGSVVRWVTPPVDEGARSAAATEETRRLLEVMRASAENVPKLDEPEDAPTAERFAFVTRHQLAILAAQRSVLLDARDNGTFDADVLADALANLDASQIAIELRGSPPP